MLDKELCKLFNVPPYLEWIQNQLDELEDELHSGKLELDTWIKINAQYEALKEARDKYWEIHIKKD